MKRKQNSEKKRENIRAVICNNLWALSLVAQNGYATFFVHALRSILIVISAYLNVNFTRWILYLIGEKYKLAYTIAFISGISLIFICCNLLLSLYNNIFLPQKQIDVGSKIRERIIRKISRINQIEFQNNKFYDLYMLGLREIDTRAMAVVITCFDLIGALLEFAVIVGVSASISKSFAFFGICAAVFDVCMGIKRNKLNYKQSADIIPDSRKRGYVNRIISQPHFFADQKAYPGFSGLIIDEYRKTTANVKSVILRYAKKIVCIDQAQQIIGTILKQMMPWIFIAILLFRNRISVAEATVLAAAALSIPSSLTKFLNNITAFYNHGMYVGNLKRIFDYEEDIEIQCDNAKDMPEKFDINIHNLSFSYYNDSNIIWKNISLKIPYGKKIAILGGNGVGKSTLLKMLIRLYKPTIGEIMIDETPIDEYDVRALRTRIAYLAQDYNVYGFSILENVLMRPSYAPEDRILVRQALEKVGLWSKIKDFPDGIDTFLTKEFNDNGEYLSGGEMQKLVLARIYAGNYSCIILDESTSSVDPVSEDEIIKTLLTVFRDKTIIFVSHKLSIANLADCVYYFSGKTLMGGKPHNELMQENKDYENFYLKQAQNYTLANSGERKF